MPNCNKAPFFHKEMQQINDALENVCDVAEAQHSTFMRTMFETGRIVGADMRRHLAQSIFGAHEAIAIVTNRSNAITTRLLRPTSTYSTSTFSSSSASSSSSVITVSDKGVVATLPREVSTETDEEKPEEEMGSQDVISSTQILQVKSEENDESDEEEGEVKEEVQMFTNECCVRRPGAKVSFKIASRSSQEISGNKKHKCCSGTCMRSLNISNPDDEFSLSAMEKTPHTCCDGRCEKNADGTRQQHLEDTESKVCCSGVCERPRSNADWKYTRIAREESSLEVAQEDEDMEFVETVDTNKTQETEQEHKEFIEKRVEWKRREARKAKEATKKENETNGENLEEEECCKATCEGENQFPRDLKEVGDVERRITILDPQAVHPTSNEHMAKEEGECCKEERECCKKDMVVARKIIKKNKLKEENQNASLDELDKKKQMAGGTLEDDEVLIGEEVQVIKRECCIRRPGLKTELKREYTAEKLPNNKEELISYRSGELRAEKSGEKPGDDPKRHQCCSGKCMRTLNVLNPNDECPHCVMEKTSQNCCDRRCERNVDDSDGTGSKACCSGVCDRPRSNLTWKSSYENALSPIGREESEVEEALRAEQGSKSDVERIDNYTEPGRPQQTKEEKEEFIKKRTEWKKKKKVKEKRRKVEEKKAKKKKKGHEKTDEEEVEPTQQYKITEECCRGSCKGEDQLNFTDNDKRDLEEVGDVEKRIKILDVGVAVACPTCHEVMSKEEGICCKEERECCKEEKIIVRKIMKKEKEGKATYEETEQPVIVMDQNDSDTLVTSKENIEKQDKDRIKSNLSKPEVF